MSRLNRRPGSSLLTKTPGRRPRRIPQASRLTYPQARGSALLFVFLFAFGRLFRGGEKRQGEKEDNKGEEESAACACRVRFEEIGVMGHRDLFFGLTPQLARVKIIKL